LNYFSSIIKHQSSSINHQSSIINHQASIMSAKHQAPPTLNPKPTPGGVTPPFLTACTRFNNKTWQESQDWKAQNQSTYEQIYQRPLKCIYGSPREMSHTKMPPHVKILVIEMNNDENQIKGIGVIQNQTAREVYRTPPQRLVTPPQRLVTPPQRLVTPPPPTITPPPVTSVPVPPPTVPDLPPRIVFNKLFSDRNYTRYIYIGNEYYATKEELERNHTADAQYINEHLATLIIQPAPTIIQSLERLLFKGPRHMKRGSGITLCSVSPSLRRSVAPQPRNSAIPQLRANAAQSPP
jgi:hypothetical protein